MINIINSNKQISLLIITQCIMMPLKLMLISYVISSFFVNDYAHALTYSLVNTNGFNGVTRKENQGSADVSLSLLNELLTKCGGIGGIKSNLTSSLDACDMCSLCQNGAFCRQKSKKQPSSYQPNTFLSTSSTSSSLDSLALLRSLIDFTCYCVPGYTGTYCQIDINECLSQPCSNNSTCIDRINMYECKCPNGFTGDHCEININECDSSPCMHGSKCIDLIDGYYCQCLTGFTGSTCGVNINECESSPCLNGANCVDLVNGFECNCTHTGFTGRYCEINIDDCLTANCMHNSTCTDGINSFRCNCHPGYEGKRCEVDVDECKSSPCVLENSYCWQNSDVNNFPRRIDYFKSLKSQPSGANATNTLDGDETHLTFNYARAAGYWCECKPGFAGVNCEIKINECQSNPCGFNGKCIDLVNEYKCACYPGYTGKTCEENLDECKLNAPCASESKCIDLKPDYSSLLSFNTTNKMLLDINSDTNEPAIHLDGYYCDCSDLNDRLFRETGTHDVIYAGQNCTHKLNACESLKHLCKHGSTCQSILSSNKNSLSNSSQQQEQDILCLCNSGYTGKYCEYSTEFRMDGTYSINNISVQTVEANSIFHLKFDFRLGFFHKSNRKQPLLYIERNKSSLLFQMTAFREYLNIRNDIFNINERMAFYTSSTSEQLWHSLDILVLLNENLIEINYSVKNLNLIVKKLIKMELKSIEVRKFSLTIGKYFRSNSKVNPNYNNNNLLSGVCFRDFILNENYLFKTNDLITIDTFGVESNQLVKYGCNNANNQCNSAGSKSICLNNSTCIYKWFGHECINCVWPYYGNNCQFEATKLAFINPNTLATVNTYNYYYNPMEQTKQSYLIINLIQSKEFASSDAFKIQFNFNRIFNANDKSTKLRQFTFLLLKQASVKSSIHPSYSNNFKSIFYYLMGISEEGYLEVKKIQSSYDLNDFDYNMSNKYKTLWSVRNENVNLNSLEASHAPFKIGLKLNKNYLELSVNDTHLSRFELVNNRAATYYYSYASNNLIDHEEKFEIETVIFSCFDSTFYAIKNDLTFIVNDLSINQNLYVFKSSPMNKIKLLVLDNRGNYLLEEQTFQTEDILKKPTSNLLDYIYVDLFNSSQSDSSILTDINNNDVYCKQSQLNNKRNCFLSTLAKIQSLTSSIKNYNILNTARVNSDESSSQNITCQPKRTSRIESSNTNYVKNVYAELSSTNVSTCQKYSSIQRNFLSNNLNDNKESSSYVNYFFDFDETNTYFLTSSNSSIINETLSTSSNKQRRLVTYKNVDFYSLAFNLSMSGGINNKNFVGAQDVMFNLFTLNTFDDLTSNQIFLFGVNVYFRKSSPSLTQYQFEIFTNKQSVKTSFQHLNASNIEKNLDVNLTFTINSIELRLDNNRGECAAKLMDKYFNLFFRSMLKAYGSFQLNISSTSAFYPTKKQSQNEYLISICMSNVKLVTRRPIISAKQLNMTTDYDHKAFNLIDQTKSMLLYQNKRLNDLKFDQCGVKSDMVTKDVVYNINPGVSRIIDSFNNRTNQCYLISKIDVATNKKISDFYDCNCTSSNSNCSYLFWSKDRGMFDESNLLEDTYWITGKVASACSSVKDFACFNNGTCVDNLLTNSSEPSYSCQCQNSYVGERCEEYDPCANNQCSKDSICIKRIKTRKSNENNDNAEYECKCNEGYLGRYCTIKFSDTCLATPCLNGATCLNITVLESPQKLSYECMCKTGYEGKRCEKRIDYCKLYEPCSNGARCVNTIDINKGEVSYKCSCNPGWKGVNCTQDIDECAQMRSKSTKQCSGNGKCVNTIGSFKCQCNNYFYGDNCEHRHICQTSDGYDSNTPCKNSGFCEVVGSLNENKYDCKCLVGYAGINCSFPTCDLQPCKHQSTCNMVSLTQFDCNCTGTGYVGRLCDTLINEPECKQTACFGNQTCDPNKCECETINCDEIYQQLKSKPREIMYHLILWPLLGIMLALLIILFSIFIMKMKKSRATRGTYSPSRHEQQASRIEFNMDLKRPPEERLI